MRKHETDVAGYYEEMKRFRRHMYFVFFSIAILLLVISLTLMFHQEDIVEIEGIVYHLKEPKEKIITMGKEPIEIKYTNNFFGTPDFPYVYCENGVVVEKYFTTKKYTLYPCLSLKDGKCAGEGKLCYIRRG
jgi:hypothetical protein